MTQFKACISALQSNDEIKIMTGELYTYVDEYLSVSKFLDGHPISQEPTVDNLLIDSLPSETINSLHESVKLMMAAGSEEECCHLYSRCRSQFLQKFLRRLQLSDFKSGGSHPSFIQMWLKACYTALRILFPWEKRLFHHVFSGFSSAADLSFMKVCRELTSDLLNFPNNLKIESLPLNYVEKTLKMFQTLSNLIAEFEPVFCDEYSVSLKNEAIASLGRLKEGYRLKEECIRLEEERIMLMIEIMMEIFTLTEEGIIGLRGQKKMLMNRVDTFNCLAKAEKPDLTFTSSVRMLSLGRLREGCRLKDERVRLKEKCYWLTAEIIRLSDERIIGLRGQQEMLMNLVDIFDNLDKAEKPDLTFTLSFRMINETLKAMSKNTNPAAGCRYYPKPVVAGQHCRYAFRRPPPSAIGRRFRSSGHRR